jgi:DNA-binding NarL/FixJ family response regulator
MGRDMATKGKAKKRVRIVLVDDHPLVRERLAEIIHREADLMVCGEAEDRSEALKVVEAQRPGLVVVDLSLKNSDGMELIKDIHFRWPSLRMLVVSMHDESLYAERVLRAGAQGYITKQEATRKILLAIRRVLAGGLYLNERIATQIIRRLTSHPNGVPATPVALLADRELQVFELTGRGLNSREIASRLHVAAKTVETYWARIREKLKLKDGNQLLQFAISWTHKN